jgi:hypothetical protein
MRIRTLLLAAATFAAGPAAAQNVSVPLDEVRVIAFQRPVATVYVGNPVIADITMIDPRHAFVLGKSFGGTNIVALDGTGAQISSSHVTVFSSSGATVTLQKGVNQTTYACASSRCEASPTPGDGKDVFESTMDQISKHQDLGTKTAEAK